MNYARIASKLREQIIKFSGELSLGWPKVLRRFPALANGIFVYPTYCISTYHI